MSDISIHFSLLDLIIAAPIFGWPGLLIGAALGAWHWKSRRILGGFLGAALGCAIWFVVRLLTL